MNKGYKCLISSLSTDLKKSKYLSQLRVLGPSSETGNLEIRSRIPITRLRLSYIWVYGLMKSKYQPLKLVYKYAYMKIVATARRQYLYL